MNHTEKIIALKRSIIPSLDVGTLERAEQIVAATCDVKGVGAYKIGFELVIPYGMPQVVKVIRKHTKLPIIYDHQKAATDVPFTGERFATVCKQSGVDAVILFPFTGPATQRAWIEACKKQNLGIIVGGEMTHDNFLSFNNGYIIDDAPEKIYLLAAELGVTDFVVPGNKPDRILKYRKLLEKNGVKPVFYSPGLISQGGRIEEGAKAAGDCWHAIIGRALYDIKNEKEIRKKTQELVKTLQ